MKKNFLKFIKKKLQPEKSFSILGEDILIKSFFNPEYIGNYVDIGCGRPISANNTFLFYKKGWRGLLIDPHNDIYKTKEKRTEDIVLNSCIKDIKNKEKKAILFYRKKWLELSSIDKKNFDFMNIFFKDYMEEDKKILKKEVNLIDANDIKNIFNFKNIDILSLDIEMNCENIVLDFIEIFEPKIIIYEKNYNEKINWNNFNYELIAMNEINNIIINKNYKKNNIFDY